MSELAPQPSTSSAPAPAPPTQPTEDQVMLDAPAAPEHLEVIYVQNLNEKIKLPGKSAPTGPPPPPPPPLSRIER